MQFRNKHGPLDWSPWPLQRPQLACQGVLIDPVDGWLHYCTSACCVTSSSTKHRHTLFHVEGCCFIVCTEGNKCTCKQQTGKTSSRWEKSLIIAGDRWWADLTVETGVQHLVGHFFLGMLDAMDLCKRAESRSCSCFFIWQNLWSGAAVRNEKWRVESGELMPPQQVRYGPDQGAPPSSSCTLSELY